MKPASILITDDESGIRLMLRTALESDGYSVLEASNGQEALDVVQDKHPDLMVLDLNMPVMDGMAVLEHMKALASSDRPRVIVLTAYGSIPTAVKATRLGAMDFLEKPITPVELRKSVHGVLEEPDPDSPEQVTNIPGVFDEVLARISKSLRIADYATAEAMLMKAADSRHNQTAAYFNLLGVLYEAQNRLRLADKCYNKALNVEADYAPALNNLRRLIELRRTGRTEMTIQLGDEFEDVWMARLPESKN
ncbi:MAG: response regulator [Tepidisphaeraceae bacterium]|jgi:DNA-binding response OmpR family regulator